MINKEKFRDAFFRFFDTLNIQIRTEAKINYENSHQPEHWYLEDGFLPTDENSFPKEAFINCGFIWSETPQGEDYWEEVERSIREGERSYLKNRICSFNSIKI